MKGHGCHAHRAAELRMGMLMSLWSMPVQKLRAWRPSYHDHVYIISELLQISKPVDFAPGQQL